MPGGRGNGMTGSYPPQFGYSGQTGFSGPGGQRGNANRGRGTPGGRLEIMDAPGRQELPPQHTENRNNQGLNGGGDGHRA